MQDDVAFYIEIEEQAVRWSRSEVVRRFIEAVEIHQRALPMTNEVRRRTREWLSRARRHADRLDPLQNGYLNGILAPRRSPPATTSAASPAPPPASAPGPGTQRIGLSISQVVAQSGLSRSFLYREMDEGRLPFVKKGRRRLILATVLADYMTRSEVLDR